MTCTVHAADGSVLDIVEGGEIANRRVRLDPKAVEWRNAEGVVGGYKTKPKREESAPFVLPRRSHRRRAA